MQFVQWVSVISVNSKCPHRGPVVAVSFCTKIWREGMVFQAVTRSPRDSNVIIWDKCSREKCVAAHILTLFTDATATTTPAPSFAVIEHHVELSEGDHVSDPYQRFGFPVAGALYHNKFHPPEVISSNKIITQFAKTTFIHKPLNVKVAHILPIFKVCILVYLQVNNSPH